MNFEQPKPVNPQKIETDIRKADKSRKILAFIQGNIIGFYDIIDWSEKKGLWVSKGWDSYEYDEIKAWEYVFDTHVENHYCRNNGYVCKSREGLESFFELHREKTYIHVNFCPFCGEKASN